MQCHSPNPDYRASFYFYFGPVALLASRAEVEDRSSVCRQIFSKPFPSKTNKIRQNYSLQQKNFAAAMDLLLYIFLKWIIKKLFALNNYLCNHINMIIIVIILNRRSMPHKRTGRKLSKFPRLECAKSQRDVTRDCSLIG